MQTAKISDEARLGEALQIGLFCNLPQDIEILKPIIELSDEFQERQIHLVILLSPRMQDSAEPVELKCLARGQVILTLPESPSRAAEIIQRESKIKVLVSASESSAGAHSYVHETFLRIPPTIKKVTLQHGWECLGFRQHRQQVEQFRLNLTTAADYVCAWEKIEHNPTTFANVSYKLVSTGVCKSVFSKASWPTAPQALQDTGPPRVLLGDNRNSPRFVGTSEIVHWSHFCHSVGVSNSFKSSTRHHQGKIVKKSRFSTFNSLSQAGFVISPPSTILIDAIAVGCIPIVFSTGQLPGSLDNYGPMRSVASVNELSAMILNEDLKGYFQELRQWILECIASPRGDLVLAKFLIDLANAGQINGMI